MKKTSAVNYEQDQYLQLLHKHNQAMFLNQKLVMWEERKNIFKDKMNPGMTALKSLKTGIVASTWTWHQLWWAVKGNLHW